METRFINTAESTRGAELQLPWYKESLYHVTETTATFPQTAGNIELWPGSS